MGDNQKKLEAHLVFFFSSISMATIRGQLILWEVQYILPMYVAGNTHYGVAYLFRILPNIEGQNLINNSSIPRSRRNFKKYYIGTIFGNNDFYNYVF